MRHRAAITEQHVMVAAKRTTKNVESESKSASNSNTEANKTTNGKKWENIIFIVLQKNVKSLNSSERFEELTQQMEGWKWDAKENQ